MITKEELLEIESNSRESFIELEKERILRMIKFAASFQKRTCEVPYHPLLDSFFEELIQGGLKIESRTLDKITLSWSN